MGGTLKKAGRQAGRQSWERRVEPDILGGGRRRCATVCWYGAQHGRAGSGGGKEFSWVMGLMAAGRAELTLKLGAQASS